MPPVLLLRIATPDDIPALTELVAQSALGLQGTEYTRAQIEGALGTVYGIDRVLVDDGTYFLVELDDRPVACGGWSQRRTEFGSSQSPVKDDRRLDPAVDPARIRGFFVDPAMARRGLGTRILNACESAAREVGFQRFELTATLTGVPLYARHGYEPGQHFHLDLPNGEVLPVVRMSKSALAGGGGGQAA